MARSDTWRRVARALIGEPQFTPREVAEQSGVDLEIGRRLWRALGFPPVPDDDRIFTSADVAILRAVCALLDQNSGGLDGLVQLTRVTGQSLARLSEAQVAATADRLASVTGPEPGAAPAEMISEAMQSLMPSLEPFLSYAWRRHLLAAIFRLAPADGTETTAARPLTVGFADLVGFTAFSAQLDARGLAAMVDRFEALAYEHIPERGGRVIKMIGDEVMFSAETPGVGAEIALALVEAYAGDATLPDVRIGLAHGAVLSWEGDLFGSTVNLASRLANIARAGTVLVSDELGRQLEARSEFALRHLRPLALKGIGRVRFWVLRRAGTTAPMSPAEPFGVNPGRRRRRAR